MIFAEALNTKSFMSLIRYRILVVDDDLTNRTLIEAILRSQSDFDVHTVSDAASAVEYLSEHLADIVLIDTTLPDADGYALCSHIKFNLGLSHVPILLFSNDIASGDRSRAMETGAEDIIAKPFQRFELMVRLRNLLRLKSLQDQVSEVEHVMFTMSALIEARDNYTHGHAERVATLVERLGHAAGMTDEEIQMLRRAAFLKDIGKAGIPDEMLNANVKWTTGERESMTDRLVMPTPDGLTSIKTPRLLPILRHCHENFDGTGYPDQLAGDEIPLGSRLISIADSYDAMTSDRPFRQAMSRDEALTTLRKGSGTQWDPSLVELFIACVSQSKPQTRSRRRSSLLAA